MIDPVANREVYRFWAKKLEQGLTIPGFKIFLLHLNHCMHLVQKDLPRARLL
jgi:hypothetical protein